MLRNMTPSRVKKIRRMLGFSQEEFARTLWVTYSTVNRWEAGRAAPFGVHLRILQLIEESLATRSFRTVLGDPRATDPMFLLHRLLEPLYGETRPWKRASTKARVV